MTLRLVLKCGLATCSIAANTACGTIPITITKFASNRGHVSLSHWHARKVNSRLTSHTCQGKDLMFLVAGGVMSSYVGLVLQAILAAMLQALRRHMRTRLKYGSATDNDVWLSWFIVLRNSKASLYFSFSLRTRVWKEIH